MPRLTQPRCLTWDFKPLMAPTSKALWLLLGSVESSTAATSLGQGHIFPIGQQGRYLPSSPLLLYYTQRKPKATTGSKGHAGHRKGVSLEILLQIPGNLTTKQVGQFPFTSKRDVAQCPQGAHHPSAPACSPRQGQRQHTALLPTTREG